MKSRKETTLIKDEGVNFYEESQLQQWSLRDQNLRNVLILSELNFIAYQGK